jgi:hypothetical protein
LDLNKEEHGSELELTPAQIFNPVTSSNRPNQGEDIVQAAK